ETGEVSTSETLSTMDVEVNAVVDTATLLDSYVDINEDTAFNIDIQALLVDQDGSESIVSVTFSQVPDGAVFSHGTVNADDTVTVLAEDLAALTLTPPLHDSTDFTLDVMVTHQDEDPDSGVITEASSTAQYHVSVIPVADVPTLQANDISGNEDEPISLDITADLVDLDGSESITAVRFEGVPEGAQLSTGADQGSGVWIVNIDDLASLTIQAPAHSSDDFILSATALVNDVDPESGLVSQVSDTISFNVEVLPVSEQAVVVASARGDEDTAIALNLDISQPDADGSESITDIVISGVPADALLSAGVMDADGKYHLTVGELAGLSYTPSLHDSQDITLTVEVTTEDVDPEGVSQSVEISSHQITVQVDAVADAPTLVMTPATGDEDTAITLDIMASLVDLDGSESVQSIVISDVPVGATLSAGVDNGDNSWTLSVDQLVGLTITPPLHDSEDFSLSVLASVADVDPETGEVSTSETLSTMDVEVNAVVDTATLLDSYVDINEDTAFNIDIQALLVDQDGSESIVSVTFSQVPDGAVFSHGTVNADDTVTVLAEDLAALTLTPPLHDSTDFTLDVMVTHQDEDPDSGVITEASSTAQYHVSVIPVADVPTLQANDISGNEDEPISLDITADLVDLDGSESITAVRFEGVPEGAQLSTGADQGSGVWIVNIDDLASLTIQAPAHSSDDFILSATALVNDVDPESGLVSQVSDTISFNVEVLPVSEQAVVVASARGDEDTAIALNLDISQPDADGSESITDIVISGVPADALLSAGVMDADGKYHLTVGELAGLSYTPSLHDSQDITLTVEVTTEDVDPEGVSQSVEISSHQITVQVDAVADAPTLVMTPAIGDEDTAITLDIMASLVDLDGSESVQSIVISDVPVGATLSAGVDNGDNSWTLSVDQLVGLTITPPLHDSEDFSLSVLASVADVDPETGEVSTSETLSTMDVEVNAVVDTATLLDSYVDINEDTAFNIDIQALLVDQDGSESIVSVTFSQVPDGAVFSHGTVNAD
ncbi:hypothetical protein, partial [Oleiphilus sp. HI0066]|uniref:hypothetical protein n=1 Tax=Oleiphilus sp. HI0066 TaxID=1822242 RepID=UPI000A3F31A3